jgi:hypothetical protein
LKTSTLPSSSPEDPASVLKLIDSRGIGIAALIKEINAQIQTEQFETLVDRREPEEKVEALVTKLKSNRLHSKVIDAFRSKQAATVPPASVSYFNFNLKPLRESAKTINKELSHDEITKSVINLVSPRLSKLQYSEAVNKRYDPSGNTLSPALPTSRLFKINKALASKRYPRNIDMTEELDISDEEEKLQVIIQKTNWKRDRCDAFTEQTAIEELVNGVQSARSKVKVKSLLDGIVDWTSQSKIRSMIDDEFN